MAHLKTRSDLFDLVLEALEHHGGKAHLQQVAKYIWDNYSGELGRSPLAYTWQYDYRWVASELRKQGKLLPADDCPKGVWILA